MEKEKFKTPRGNESNDNVSEQSQHSRKKKWQTFMVQEFIININTMTYFVAVWIGACSS